MGITEDVADNLAVETLDQIAGGGDPELVEKIGEILGASSQTLKEAFLTSCRVRRAEARARITLSQGAAKLAAKPLTGA